LPDADAFRDRRARVAPAGERYLGAVERRVLHECSCTASGRVDARDAERRAAEPYLVALEQRARRLGQLAEAIDQPSRRASSCSAVWRRRGACRARAVLHVAAVARGSNGRHVEIYLGVEIEVFFERRRGPTSKRARALEHARVEREAHFLDLARLRFAEHSPAPRISRSCIAR